MENDNVFVGVDYASAFVQVCVLDKHGRVLGNRRLENTWQVLSEYVSAHGCRVRAAIEACNGAADLADELLQHGGWSIDLAHPGYVERMKRNPDKTDFTDARMLADLVRVGYLPRVWLAPQNIRELRRLVRYRQDLVNRQRALKQRIGALLRDHRVDKPTGVAWTKRWKCWLKAVTLPEETRWVIDRSLEELEEIERRITVAEERLVSVTKDDPFVARLRMMKGIGLVTACVLRAEVGDPTRFHNGKQLARFCGLTPQNASSGTRQADAGLVRATNRTLRATLIEAAHRLKRFEPRWQKFAADLKARGKPGSVVAAAVANRWVRGLFHDLVQLRPAA
jgi:transposase